MSVSFVGAVDGGASGFVAGSHCFIPPTTSEVPRHESHVYVEHTNGVFVPLNVHMQIESKQQLDGLLSAGQRGGQTTWDFHDDAKDYIESLRGAMMLLRRFADLLSGLACGFSLFRLLDVYTTTDSRAFLDIMNSTRNATSLQLLNYSNSVDVVPKCFLFLSLMLVVLSLLPMAFDFAMDSLQEHIFGPDSSVGAVGRSGSGIPQSRIRQSTMSASVATADGPTTSTGVGQSRVGISPASGSRIIDSASIAGSGPQASRFQPFGLARRLAVNTYDRIFRFLGIASPSDSPLRHLMRVRFLAFVAALAMSILEVALVFEVDVLTDPNFNTSRLDSATLVRTALFIVAFLSSLIDV